MARKPQSTPDKASKAAGSRELRVSLRLVFGDEIAIGPGKADLLELIRETGSIAAAGRAMGMSYKRAWMLVATMNDCFTEPLVAASRGGKAQGGAALTETGEAVLAAYRKIMSGLDGSEEIAAIRGLIAKAGG